MKAGVLGEITGTFDDVPSFVETSVKDGVEYARSLQVKNTGTLVSGARYFEGEAAIQDIDETERVAIDSESGDITVSEKGIKTGKYANFVIISDEIMTVGSGSGTFAFRLLQEAHPGVNVERVELDLNAYADDYYSADEVNPWQVGFYGNIGDAEKGVVYGDDVFSDTQIGEVLERSQLNQLGLEYPMLGQDLKVTMAESGYIEVYNPSNYETSEFAEYIATEISDYISP